MLKYKPSTMLRRGADLLEREERKWCQGAYVGFCGAVCAMGAVFFANATKEEATKADNMLDEDGEFDDDSADTFVYQTLKEQLGEDALNSWWGDVVDLNDVKAQTREDAIALMRAKADELAAQGQ